MALTNFDFQYNNKEGNVVLIFTSREEDFITAMKQAYNLYAKDMKRNRPIAVEAEQNKDMSWTISFCEFKRHE